MEEKNKKNNISIQLQTAFGYERFCAKAAIFPKSDLPLTSCYFIFVCIFNLSIERLNSDGKRFNLIKTYFKLLHQLIGKYSMDSLELQRNKIKQLISDHFLIQENF